MSSCVIDIGSNTIRAVVFDEQRNVIFNHAVASWLFDYTENAVLSAAGIDKLCAAVGELCRVSACFGCDYYAFATSAFRDLENGEAVCDAVFAQCNIKIRVLSGADEAECDYLGIRESIGAVCGIGVDLGGGSCQVLDFDAQNLQKSSSIPAGTARLVHKFIPRLPPEPTEIDEIYAYINDALDGLGFLRKDGREIYAIGGSARAALQLKRAIMGNSPENSITTHELCELIKLAQEPGTDKLFFSIVRARHKTVIAGAAVLLAIANYVGASRINVLSCGVREGFIKKYIN